jgi:transcription elongation factor Elf1
MEEFATIQCPFCGQSFDVAIDTSLASQRFTTDCEVCCRPFEVVAECAAGAVSSVDVVSG